jgi:hypothetical protein
MPEYQWDPDDETFVDEYGDPVDIEPSDEMIEAALAERGQEADEVAGYINQVIGAMEQKWGRKFSEPEAQAFASDLIDNDFQPGPWIEAHNYDLGDDESRRAYMQERLTGRADESYSSESPDEFWSDSDVGEPVE